MAGLIGQRLGQYEITALLGEGGMATVYRARQAAMSRDVALKVIESRLARNPEFVKRFEREARTIAALSQSHILKVFDYGHQDDLLYLVMELLTGGSLADRIRGGLLPLPEVSRILAQIASALDYAHRKGVVHRDLKPQNVLLDEAGDAHLTDFGIARVISETTMLTQSGVAMGTPAYMSPEQCRGAAVDGRSDVYALGVMLFEMLAGRVPFQADTPVGMAMQHLQEPPPRMRSLRPELPAAVEAVMDRALAKDPDRRFQTAGELAAAFEMALRGELPPGLEPPVEQTAPVPFITDGPPVPPPPDRPEPPARRGGRGGVLAIGLIAILAALGLLAAILGGGGPDATPTPEPTTVIAALPTETPTVTATPTETPAPTETATDAPELTEPPEPPEPTALIAASPTDASTATQAPTETPSPTETATATPTATDTPTPTRTPSSTPTATPSRTPTLTVPPRVTRNADWTPQIRAFDGVEMVLVPPGCFRMGSTDAQIDAAMALYRQKTGNTAERWWFTDEQPVHEVCFDQPFWIDRYEVMNGQFARFGGQAGRASARTDADRPRERITWFEARDFCALRGARLPTEAEWEYAARGPDGLVYPWGNTFVGDNVVYGGNSGGQTANVGSRPGGASWVGALDLSGNVWEWVADWYDEAYYSASPRVNPQGPASGANRVLRGGSWFYFEVIVRAAGRYGVEPGDEDIGDGFRCARSY